jgi:serine/threonine protein kinase
MRRRVLLVEGDARRRGQIRDALIACGLEIVESSSTTEAIGRMKHASFAGLVVADEQRQLALKGLCAIARKDHEGAHVFVMLKEGSDRHRVQDAAGETATLIPQAATLEEIAARVINKFGTSSPDVWRYAKTRVLSKSKLWEVHVAKSPKTNGDVMLAQLTESFAKDQELRGEFVEAASSAKPVLHENLPRIREVGGRDDIPFVASDLTAGLSLGELFRRTPKNGAWISPNLAAWIASEVAAALEPAHASGVIHGAISPETLWITGHGRVQVLHLGIAGFLGMLERSMGASLGVAQSAPYLSPEQLKQTGTDARTDVFLIGLVLHELLSRLAVFGRANAIETRNAIAAAPVPRPPSQVPEPIADVTMACLERSPAFRPKTARELRSELVTALAGAREPPSHELTALLRSLQL